MAEDIKWFSSRLHHHLDAYLPIRGAQVEALYRHYELLARWSRKMNLTSIRWPEEIVVRHYCESWFFAAHVPAGWNDFADIGSGAGFPGVPMAVLRPNWKVTLVESHQRRAVFLRESTRGLPNVSVVAKRSEDLDGRFGVVVSRAVDYESVLALVPCVATRVGLLIGDADYQDVRARAGLEWEAVVAIPWGQRRLAVYGFTWNPKA